MRTLVAAFLGAILSAPTALADTGGLTAGKPAGIRQAQEDDGHTMVVLAGVGLAGIGIALALSHNDNNKVATTTSSTSTAP